MRYYILLVVAFVACLFLPDCSDARIHGPVADRMYACNHASSVWTQREMECAVTIRFGAEAANAKLIVACESQWNPRAVSRTDDHGLFQINRRWNSTAWKRGESIYDPVWNTLQAYRFYQTRGWADWTCGRIVGLV